MKNCAIMLTMPQDEQYIVHCVVSLVAAGLDHVIITCPTRFMWQERANGMEIKEQDRTIEYLGLLQRRYGDKVQVVYREGWESSWAQWQSAFAKMAELGYEDGDSFVFSMPDEIWDVKNLDRMLELSRSQQYNCSPVHLTFFGDFGWQHEWREGRNYRFEKDMSMNPGCEFTYPRHPRFNCRINASTHLNDVFIHHFQWVHNLKHFQWKAFWNGVYYGMRPRANPMEVLEKWMKNKKTSIQMNLDAAPVYTKSYKGELPEIMKQHPYYGKKVKEILEYKGEYF